MVEVNKCKSNQAKAIKAKAIKVKQEGKHGKTNITSPVDNSGLHSMSLNRSQVLQLLLMSFVLTHSQEHAFKKIEVVAGVRVTCKMTASIVHAYPLEPSNHL